MVEPLYQGLILTTYFNTTEVWHAEILELLFKICYPVAPNRSGYNREGRLAFLLKCIVWVVNSRGGGSMFDRQYGEPNIFKIIAISC